MQLDLKRPRTVLNTTYLKSKPLREDMERFKANLITMLDRINVEESEENAKKHISAFLEDTWYKNRHHINTKDRIDLVIHTGPEPNSPAAVMIETKKPGNKQDMISESNLGAKSMHELVLYYLRERIDNHNNDLRHCIITDGWDWFIFDAHTFDRAFYQKSKLRKDYEGWRDGQKSGNKTDDFYRHIANPALLEYQDELPVVHLDLRKVEKVLRNEDKEDDKRLIVLYKLLSPVHLLKESFANDSNELNSQFYDELLHILGLEEAKDTKTKKKIIRRRIKEYRMPGSMLENTIERLEIKDSLSRVDDPRQYGNNEEERLFNAGLELCITWVNRILFLKLLEGQLFNFHGKNPDYRFLEYRRIPDYDELFNLFFMVLAKKPQDRRDKVRDKYALVPYLNSSLFEQTLLEIKAFSIESLEDQLSIPLYSRTVLKDEKGKKAKGELRTLEYLFRFLDAYDFSSDGGEDIQEEGKSLINASVLGLIFEKINGYRDGSFFTPGFVTMYMANVSLRRAVVTKFNAEFGWNAKTFDDLEEVMESGADHRAAYNAVIDEMRICDPAVGSGHFPVSVLNELLAIKSDLGIFCYRDGKKVKEFTLRVENDELFILDVEENKPFEYRVGNGGRPIQETQRLQEALFHEKQKLIENCIFGVDINPNSVKICRLRLWIELLKNAYYTVDSDYKELETLPNIDINIKQGNSLVSRYGLETSIAKSLRKAGFTIEQYKKLVRDYQSARDAREKSALLDAIDKIKNNFQSQISRTDSRRVRLDKLKGELFLEQDMPTLFADLDLTAKQKRNLKAKKKQLKNEVDKLTKLFAEIENNVIYRESFEWRFEFPEVLDAEGNFVGFDVVIANPPYIRQEEIKDYKGYFKDNFKTFVSSADLYVYFVELGMNLARTDGEFCYIIPNKWMRARYGLPIREWMKERRIYSIVDFGDLPVFKEATTYPCILALQNAGSRDFYSGAIIPDLDFEDLNNVVNDNAFEVDLEAMESEGWSLIPRNVSAVLSKIKAQGVPLGEYVDGKIYYGIKTGLNEAFVIDAATREALIKEDPRSAEVIKPFLAGRDVKRYAVRDSGKFLILLPNGVTNSKKLEGEDGWEWLNRNYRAISDHLSGYKKALQKRYDQGNYWWELRACDYYWAFEQSKIVLPDISNTNNFAIDYCGAIAANTGYVIPVEDLFLLGLLNSKLVLFYYGIISQVIQGGYFRFIYQYLELIPILVKVESKVRIESLVTEILTRKKENLDADTISREAEIDQLVYELYGLNEEDIAIVEEVIG
jgi:type II restriction/modification system DNA methylase subunit YeeA